jgi:predicted DNA-binding transcriptional regulator YafY
MNRTDRLLAMVLEIRLRGDCRAEDLAHVFGISKRTVYRDIEALCEAGVPIVSVMGQGYQLAKGYFLPPLSFTEQESLVLLLGLEAIDKSFDAEYQAAIKRASGKIKGVLSDEMRARVEALQSSVFLGPTWPLTSHESNTLVLLRRAILDGYAVQFRYFSGQPSQGKVSFRKADPYSIFCLHGVWFTYAYCHLRQEGRNFRLSRMEEVTLTNHSFTRPATYSHHEQMTRDDRHVVVRLVFDEDVQAWLNSTKIFYMDSSEPHPDGVQITLRVRDMEEIIQWLMGWARYVRVLEPDFLRERLLEEAQAILKQHAELLPNHG